MAAASAIARAHGLGPANPHVLQDWNNTIVHLRPLPLVARVSTSPLAPLARSLEREVTVATHLAARAAPVIPPSQLLPPGPHEHAGLLLTFWEYCEGRLATEDDAVAAGAALASVHRAFAGFKGELPSFCEQLAAVEGLLEDSPLALEYEDRTFLRELYARLVRELPDRHEQPLHGEAHLANAMLTREGIRWFDFESVCRGPLEWDLSALPDEALGAFEAVDTPLLSLLRRLRSLCVAVWCSVQPERAPRVAEAAEFHLRAQRELG
jgi:phosphotransferase family enzyme